MRRGFDQKHNQGTPGRGDAGRRRERVLVEGRAPASDTERHALALLIGGLMALALSIAVSPLLPATALAADAQTGASAASAAQAAPAADAADQAAPARADGAKTSIAPDPRGSQAAAKAGAVAPHSVVAPARPLPSADAAPAPARAATDPATATRPDAPATDADHADAARFVTIRFRTSPGTAGTVRPAEVSVRASDGAGLSGCTTVAEHGFVFQGWYNGSRLVSQSPVLSRDETLAALDHDADGNLVPTTLVARYARPSAALSLAKELANAPAEGSCYREGDAVTFRVTVTNTGTVPLDAVTFEDSLASLDPMTHLGIGQSRSVEYSHVVTAADVAAEALVNTVSARGSSDAYHLEATAGPESATALTGTLGAGETFVVYGAYPADAGSVSHAHCIVHAVTGEGLEAVTATPAEGYEFAGWYEDDERVCTDATLEPDTALNLLNRGRTPYAPTLFLAHFTKEEPEPATPDDDQGTAGDDQGASGGTTTPDQGTGGDAQTPAGDENGGAAGTVPGGSGETPGDEGSEPGGDTAPGQGSTPDDDVTPGEGNTPDHGPSTPAAPGATTGDGQGNTGTTPGTGDANASTAGNAATPGTAADASGAATGTTAGSAAASAVSPSADDGTTSVDVPGGDGTHQIPQSGDDAPAIAIILAALALIAALLALRSHDALAHRA